MKDELKAAFLSDPRHEEVNAEILYLNFLPGYENYSRPSLILAGPHGKAEASPIKGYFEDVSICVSGAISSVLDFRPKPVREKIKLNALVASPVQLEMLDSDSDVKVKVTSLEDADLVKKVRDSISPTAKIRIDCNGNLDVDVAQDLIEKLNDCNLEFVEQPCKTIEENALLRKKVDIPIALDESACTLDDIKQIKQKNAADIVVVKVQSSGGINRAYNLVESWGMDVVVSSMMESEVGINLGLELARSLDNLNYACGLNSSPIQSIVSEPFDGI